MVIYKIINTLMTKKNSMKNNKQLFIGVMLLIIFNISSNYGQQKENTADKQLPYLTTQQKQLLKEQQDLLDKTRAIFKENLSKKQLTLLKDRTITKKQRTKLLRKSLSQKQRDMVISNRSLLRIKRSHFRSSLTKRQKFRLRRFLMDRNVRDRRRLIRRLQRLISDSMRTDS